MGFFVVAQTPFLLVFEKFLQKERRAEVWRQAGGIVCAVAFRLAGLRIQVRGKEHVERSHPVLYAANHASPLDGFMLCSLLGARAALFTAPLSVFPRPVAFWMKKMGSIDVRRDVFDDVKYPRTADKDEAFERVRRAAQRGYSLIIFPEGHIEYLHVLHYFHTGATRMSASAQVPIIPVALIGADEAFPDEHHTRPGTITVHLGAPLPAPKKSELAHPAHIRRLRDQLEKRIVDMLPLRYLPSYYFARKPSKIGVFVDIDQTVYEGFTLVDLIQYLLALHRIHRTDLVRSMYWLFLERLHTVPHERAVRCELMQLHGWDVGEFNHLVDRAWHEKMLARVRYHVFALLKDHIEQGHTVVLVSEAIHPLAREFKRLFHAQALFDTQLETEVVHRHRRYTGRVTCLCYKEKKAELVSSFARRAGIDLSQSYGYGDSAGDVPFLTLVGHPIAVHPDRTLKQVARKHGWPTVD